MSRRRVVVVGGGAAGFFAAITCAEAASNAEVTVFERSPQFLAKVRISGGGRCNVTHACFDPRDLSRHYPRGGSELLAPFQIFQPRHTLEWFESRGVKLKTEPDGRMFPATDSSGTVIDCLLRAARTAGVSLHANAAPRRVTRRPQGGFELEFDNGQALGCDRVLLATGGCRTPAAGHLAVSLGHTLAPPVPSLFTFHVAAPWLRDLAGITVPAAEVSLPALKLRERGPLLVTHSGLSGPVILRLSAWGARALHELDYQTPLRLNWLPHLDVGSLARQFESSRVNQPARLVVNTPLPPLAARLWENLVLAAGISRETRWAGLSRGARHRLGQHLTRTDLQLTGKTLNQEEFVTCGGVPLDEVNFRTMESRICPELFLAGELLDIDGLTGGFNFQSAWTTGWLAGRAMGSNL
jgi:hypothetical protein